MKTEWLSGTNTWMRGARLLPVLVLLGLVILSIAIMWGMHRCDVVTSHFPTVQEARSQGAFERGWLPPILPNSARHITETNNLDLNVGEGSFEFDAADYPRFVTQLTPVPAAVGESDWGSLKAKGYSLFTYSTDDTTWTLALHPNGSGYYGVKGRERGKSR